MKKFIIPFLLLFSFAANAQQFSIIKAPTYTHSLDSGFVPITKDSAGYARLYHLPVSALSGAGGVAGVSMFNGRTGNVTPQASDYSSFYVVSQRFLDSISNVRTAIDAKADITALTAHTSNTSNPHSVTRAQVGLGNADNTSDANKPVSTATQTALNGKVPNTRTLTINGTPYDLSQDRSWTISGGTATDTTALHNQIVQLENAKVDKVTGKQLSTEDYTTTEKTKLSGIATGATANSTDATLLNRANHTGTQPASTISDFQTQVTANTNVAANTSARHSHTNKALLDTYTQTEVNLADAVSKKHSHTNSTALNAVTGTNTGDETGAGIKTKLEALTGTSRLDASAIQNIPTGVTSSQVAAQIADSNAANTINFSAKFSGAGTVGAPIDIDLSTYATTANPSFTGVAKLNADTLATKADVRANGSGGSSIDLSETDDITPALQALGSNIKGHIIGVQISDLRSSTALQDGRAYISAGYNRKSQTITGVKFFLTVTGAFTADNFNGIAIYTYNAGVLTQVAISANDATIWKGTANTWQTVPFTAPITLPVGIYYIEALYNSSAQTTAPAAATAGGLANTAMTEGIFTNNAKLYIANTGQTTLTTSQTLGGGEFSTGDRYGLFIY